MTIVATGLPQHSLLLAYARTADGGETGHYTDCFAVDIAAPVDLAQFLFAFYTTPLFRLERVILRWFAARPSSDEEALAVATGAGDTFAAWHVERRAPGQVLLQDLTGRTRSWFMATPPRAGGESPARLYFGSAVLARPGSGATPWRRHLFALMIVLHRLYSRALLWSASRRLRAARGRV
jgi:hypothetical protein